MTKAVVVWSGGKDAALAYGRVKDDLEVVALLTTFSENGRSSMHGVRRELVEAQARAVGVPLVGVDMPNEPSNDMYEERMRDALDSLANEEVDAVVFGDIFLEDVRAYREETTPDAFETLFPLWGDDTDVLARDVAERFDAVTVCVNGDALGHGYVGRSVDDEFLDDLPVGVDPCGENGEFHTFVAEAPFFDDNVAYERGEVVERDLKGTTYYYQDLETEPSR